MFRVYENKIDGRRIFFSARGYTAAVRSDVRFRRKVMFASKLINFKIFGTLTYADEFLPSDSKHVSKFFMRWRKHNTRKKKRRDKVDYIWRVDYGKVKARPHYHFLANDYVEHKKAVLWWGRGFVWLRKVYSIKEIRRYLYKYMCKRREDDNDWKKHRYGTSQGVPKTPLSEWKFGHLCEEEYLRECVLVHNQNLGHLDMHTAFRKNGE